MNPTITAQALTLADVDRAFPLVREANRALTLDDWRRFATRRAASEHDDIGIPGVLVALRNGMMRGLASLERETTHSNEDTLIVSDAIVIDRARREWVARELLGGLLTVARREACDRIRISLPRSSAWLAAFWSDPDGTLFQLPVECIHMVDDSVLPDHQSNVVSLNI